MELARGVFGSDDAEAGQSQYLNAPLEPPGISRRRIESFWVFV
jgi:hypothetical protein